MRRRRLAALAALALAGGSTALAVAAVFGGFPHGVSVLACLFVVVVSGVFGALRRGLRRLIGLLVAALAMAGAIALVLTEGDLLENLLILAGILLSLFAAREAFAIRVRLARAQPPHRPVLFFNPLSGEGKASKFNLAEEARTRGIEPVELRRGEDLRSLVQEALARGADALAMAGGDGSQAIVAEMAARHDLPYACVPAGTRNHLALDLGVDRNDVVGALDAFVDGGERRVDLGEVNGRVFVNNVSLGVYAEAVQRSGYREAKIRTLLEALPDALGPSASGGKLEWRGPDGKVHHAAAAILVSNNRYRLGKMVGSGTRPRMDAGVLGVAVVPAPADRDGAAGSAPWREWSAESFEVGADTPVAAGIDGEAATLSPPLRFRIRRGALRARIAPRHPGASPSAAAPDGLSDAIRSLVLIAVGRSSH